ncbi:hypothetical protein RDWZM_005244 [Blomia tropicalis]|uniref:protein-tyrosine-phosphatase n=1 Tax=Blomia tropicalis TaxID=40697 RepID=A0A9Q0M7L7_BLOTA|nr:hypothetical protein RDWZM_005244 [Blomia tropicalis]
MISYSKITPISSNYNRTEIRELIVEEPVQDEPEIVLLDSPKTNNELDVLNEPYPPIPLEIKLESYLQCIYKDIYLMTRPEEEIDYDQLEAYNIDMILHFGTKPPHLGKKRGVWCLKYEAYDDERFVLLNKFDGIIQDIKTLIKEKEPKFLFHCGCTNNSISSAIICAYLMKIIELQPNKVLDTIKSRGVGSTPRNSGLISQLFLYNQMGCELDRSNMRYRYMMMKHFQFIASKFIPTIVASTTDKIELLFPNIVRFLHDTDIPYPLHSSIVFYICKKCRKSLFTDLNEVKAFNWNESDAYENCSEKCTTIFVEPLIWMIEGKSINKFALTKNQILCPNIFCKALIGYYNTDGQICERQMGPIFGSKCEKHPNKAVNMFRILSIAIIKQQQK